MKTDCEVIRDLLPLYTDAACSEKSRELVDEHLEECPDCRELLVRLRETELESDLRSERDSVVRNALRWFRRRTAAVGSAVSGVFMIPILVLLIINLRIGLTMSWVYIVLAALLVPAALIVVPIVMPEDKAFWTFCAFCASLMILLGVVCIYSHGNWFWIASSAVLFGLSVVFLPFVICARPLQGLLGGSNRALVVLGVDVALFMNMLSMIEAHNRLTGGGILYTLGVLAGVALVIAEILRKGKRAQ